jgi:arylsulfatase A-like enzyme
MIRAGKWKLIYYSGHRPQLFDLGEDPGEIRDLAESPEHAAVREKLTARVLENWNPADIDTVMATRRRRKEILSKWSHETKPPDTHRWQIKMEDNWLGEPPA